MKSTHHLLISAICFVLLAYEYMYNFSVITHPYMVFLTIALCGVGGWHAGAGLAKLIKETRS